MLAKTSASLFLVTALLLVACGDDDKSTPATDAGKDGALEWEPDSGKGKGDAGDKTDASTSTDAGPRECAEPRELFPAAALPRCTAETGACVKACEDADDPADCRGNCIDADTQPTLTGTSIGCQSCVSLQLFACADQEGCHDATADLFCCFADKCPAGSGSNCPDVKCATELDAAITCIGSVTPQCVEYTSGAIGDCFAGFEEEDAGL